MAGGRAESRPGLGRRPGWTGAGARGQWPLYRRRRRSGLIRASRAWREAGSRAGGAAAAVCVAVKAVRVPAWKAESRRHRRHQPTGPPILKGLHGRVGQRPRPPLLPPQMSQELKQRPLLSLARSQAPPAVAPNGKQKETPEIEPLSSRRAIASRSRPGPSPARTLSPLFPAKVRNHSDDTRPDLYRRIC